MINAIDFTNTIFISYSRESEEHILWVQKLANTLQQQGYNIILDSDINPEPEIPNDHIQSLLEFFRIHQRVAYVTSMGVVRARAELPQDKKLPFKWKVFQEKIYEMINMIVKCRYVLMIHTPRFYKETKPLFDGPHEAGLVLEEYINIHNSASNDSLNFRVISILRSGENFHYGPPNNRYFHVDFREDQKFERDVAILLQVLELPFKMQKPISLEAINLKWIFKPNSPTVHKAIEYINDISSDHDVRLLGYNTLRVALDNSIQALVVTRQLDERMQELSNEDTIRRIEKVALSYHNGTVSQKKLLEPIFRIGLFDVARRNGKIAEAQEIAQSIPSLHVRALLIAVLIEDEYN